MIQQLGAVVVAYGATRGLRECLHSLQGICPVMVIDNSASEDVRKQVDELGFIYDDPGANLGFAGGVNRALRQLPVGNDVLLVNPDATVDADLVRALLVESTDGKVGAAAPRLVDPFGNPQRVLWPFPSPRRAWRQACFGGDGGSFESGFVVGAVLLLKGAALEDVGEFDERFFLYAEETDWQRRALQRGWTSRVCESVAAVHLGGATSSDEGRRIALFHAGTETYIRKWFGDWGWLSFRLAAIARELVRLLLRPTEKRESWVRLCLYVRGPRRAAGLAS